MKNILILSRRSIGHPLSGGADRYVHEIFRRLTDHYSISVLAEGGEGQESTEQIDGITYRYFPGTLIRLLQPIRYLAKFAATTDLLIDNADVAIPWLSPLFARIPRITIIHQLVREIFYGELPRPLSDLGFFSEPLLYRIYFNSRIVTVSQSTANQLVHFGIPREKIHVVSPGCSNPYLHSSHLSRRKPGAIACVSRLIKYKGIQQALAATAIVVHNLPDAVLFVAGSGPYEQQLHKLAGVLGVSKNVTFLGRISEAEKFRLYGDSRVAISPSQREGFGISVMEANSVGTPVVGWNVPGLRDSIIDDETGLLAPFPNENAFAEDIVRLLTDDDTWTRLSQNARKWASRHSWEESAEIFRGILDSELAQGKPKL